MTLNVRTDLTPAEIAHEHFRFGAAFEARNAKAALVKPRHLPLRIGYVSGDYKASPVTWFIKPVLEHHDRTRVTTYCYSNVAIEDEVTARVKPHADYWRKIHGMSDDAVCDLIQSDKIDVLVDLSGHTLGNRLGVFARRPAMVQATWLGYLNTTGLKSIDFRITDRHTGPEGVTEELHSEALLRMPESQWCWVPFYDVPAKAAFGRRERLVFGSFNYAGKVNAETLDLWSRVLREVPDSELRIHAVSQPEFRATMLERLEARQIARDRVTFVPHLAIEKYFDAFREVDIALDTMPYNGGTTTFVTYWMGVPMVALAGNRGIARGGYSIAKSAGLEELIALDADQYVETNVRLATDDGFRVALARSLRDRLMQSALADAKRFTRDLEALFEEMIERKVASS
jgi:predicted O-linked N-acetylglucosamine transferase (SPINDLY family)